MMEEGPSTCERCGGELRRVLFPAGIIFKGSGFYKTDSRSSSSESGPPPTAKPAATGDTASGDTASGGTASGGTKAPAVGGNESSTPSATESSKKD
jgi:predicted nucleic acid-binding Zn ribbon protein